MDNYDIMGVRADVINITSLSDARDKKIITDLPPGLDFIMKVKPVSITGTVANGIQIANQIEAKCSKLLPQDL